jgi:hypothetical protein
MRLKRVDKGFAKKTLNKIIDAVNENWIQCEGRPGWERSRAGVVPPPITAGGDTAGLVLWSLTITDAATNTVKIVNPGFVKRTNALDDSGTVDITAIDSTFTAAVGKFLVLEVEPDLTTELKMISQWTGYPMPIDTVEVSGLWKVEKYYYPLYEFVAPPAEGEPREPFSVSVSDTIYARKMCPSNHLQFILTRQEDNAGHVVSAFELVPSLSCREITA